MVYTILGWFAIIAFWVIAVFVAPFLVDKIKAWWKNRKR